MFNRRESDIARVTNETPDYPSDSMLVLGVVTGATQLGSAGAYRWTYDVSEAWMVGTGYAARTNGRSLSPAYSVSELSTANLIPQVVGYGTVVGNLPAGFLPVRIPNGSAVILSPHRKSDGTLVWLIINTQAIDGICT
jgi:hypothetical protein